MERVKIASAVILFLALCSWVLALGGLGSIDAIECGTDVSNPIAVAKCSRKWSWQWWVLFFELFVILVSAVITCLPLKRLAVGRNILAHFFSMATLLVMTALNMDIVTYVWTYFDQAPLFSDFTGVDRQNYMSGAALCAGWILVIIFNFCWISCVLACDVSGTEDKDKKKGEEPIVGAVTGTERV